MNFSKTCTVDKNLSTQFSESKNIDVTSNYPNPRRWNVFDVCSWADTEGKYSASTIASLSSNEIDGVTLLSLTPNDLKVELGIKSLAERRRLLADITLLKGYDVAHSNYKESILYGELKLAIQDKHINGVYNEFVKLQIVEVNHFELRNKDHGEAIKVQSDFNKLLHLDELDANIAKHVGNVDDRTAATRLQDGVAQQQRFEMNRHQEAEIAIQSAGIEKENSETVLMTEYVPELKSFENEPTANVGKPINERCIMCNEQFDRKGPIVLPGCRHGYCGPCMGDWLHQAARDKTLLPLKCCKQLIPVDIVEKLAIKVLNKDDVFLLSKAIEESECKEKMYCPSPKCSTFINIEKMECFVREDLSFQCVSSKCNMRICIRCKGPAHSQSVPCKENAAINDEITVLQMSALGYQRCQKCKQFVELIQGCNHMTCLCSHHFCYTCGADWNPRKCHCELFDENRLIRDERRNVPQNLRGEEFNRVLNERVRNAQIEIMAEENCEHLNMEKTNEYEDIHNYRNKPYCFSCNRRLNLYGYECQTCPRKLCGRCHYHR